MGIFKYSKSEKEINQVLKMNRKNSQELTGDAEMQDLRNNADESIAQSVRLLEALGMKHKTEQLREKPQQPSRRLPELESWDVLVRQAQVNCPGQATLEDILSPVEIASCLRERDKIDREFSKMTSITNRTDLSFLAIATALQVAKSLLTPYVAGKFSYGQSFDPADRMAHNDAAIEQAHRKANDRFRDRGMQTRGTGHWINLLYQTVPYDITKGAPALGISMGGRYHRIRTLGHDPILGWIFGTANILTDCITFSNLQTNRVIRINPVTGKNWMMITAEQVRLGQMFGESVQMVKADPLNLPAALFAQAQHLKSDQYTKLGLPVPVLTAIDERFASRLYSEHYDALCFGRDVKIVGASFAVSKLIDLVISLLHGMFHTQQESKELYECRTRKILLLSSSMASCSSCICAAFTKNPKNLDLGGLLNTATHLFADTQFLTAAKKEWMESGMASRLERELEQIDRLYRGEHQG